MPKERIGDLEVTQDLVFQRRSWTFKRIGWIAMALFILAALLGILGATGPLSRTTAGDQSAPLRIEYNRFAHYLSPMSLEAHLTSGIGSDGQVRLWLSREYLEDVQVEHVTPEPESVEAGQDRITYVFNAPNHNQPTSIKFSLQAEQFGLISGKVGLDTGQPLNFSTFVYP